MQLSQSLRMIDRIGILDNNCISVLLPDTDQEGAASVAGKLKKRLAALSDPDVSLRILKVCTYPADRSCGDLQSVNPPAKQHPIVCTIALFKKLMREGKRQRL